MDFPRMPDGTQDELIFPHSTTDLNTKSQGEVEGGQVEVVIPTPTPCQHLPVDI